MNRIDKTFQALREKNETALVGFITAGDPDRERSLEIIEAMCRGGLDVLELGVPFSDPTADGPVIQRSSQRALKAGNTMCDCFELVRAVRRNFDLPIILFSYFNPIFAYGPEKFCNDAMIAGADGTLIVDLPPEEVADIKDKFAPEFTVIRLIAPTTSARRAEYILDGAAGFVYVISRTGVTGAGGVDSFAVESHVSTLRNLTGLPLCVGFGISTPQEAAQVAGYSEGVVVGSAFERLIEENLGAVDLPDMVCTRVRELRAAINPGK